MKEYIYQIEDDESDESEVFIGWIRKQGHELIRCKDCIWKEDARGLYKWCNQSVRNVTDEDFCSRAERKEE